MAIILIDPVTTRSAGGLNVRITGIDPTDHDCLHGEFSASGQQPPQLGRWDLGGVMRGGSPASNLDISSDEIADLVETARRLRGDL